MQRSKLNVGDEYIWHRYRDWRKYPDIARVVRVVDAGPFMDSGPASNEIIDGDTVRHVTRNDRGREIAVRFVEADGTTGSVCIIPPAHLRCPRVEWDGIRNAADEERRRESERREAAEKARRDRRADLTARLKAAGIDGYLYFDDGNNVTLSPTQVMGLTSSVTRPTATEENQP